MCIGLNRISKLKKISSMRASALFIPRRLRKTVTPLLLPSPRLGPDVGYSAAKRNLDLDCEKAMQDSRKHRLLQRQHDDVEVSQKGILDQIKLLRTEGQPVLPEMSEAATELRRSIVKMQTELADLEDDLFPVLAKLPNVLHASTPLHEPVVLVEAQPCTTATTSECHQLSVTASDSGCVYLHGDTARLELALLNFTSDFLAESGAVRLSCPDTVSPPISEACTALAAPCAVRLVDSSALELVGGASLSAMCAAFCRASFDSEALPLRLFAAGRIYRTDFSHGREVHQPSDDNYLTNYLGDQSKIVSRTHSSTTSSDSTDSVTAAARALLSSVQMCAVRHLRFCHADSCDAHFSQQLQQLLDLLQLMGLSCRQLQLSVHQLLPHESRRVDLQVFSPALQRWLSVAHVAQVDCHVARRLHVVHVPRGVDQLPRAVHMVEGLALHVPHVLLALTDVQTGRPVLPRIAAVLKEYM